jgi:hypothetical protein
MDVKNCSTALFVIDIAVSKKPYPVLTGLQVKMDFGEKMN